MIEFFNIRNALSISVIRKEVCMSYFIEFCYTSNVGKCRKVNQDNFFCVDTYMDRESNGTDGVVFDDISSSACPVFAVFDGMGGEECGEVASYLSAKQLSEFEFGKDIKNELLSYCELSNKIICEYVQENGLNYMGTTAAMLAFSKKKIGLCNVGDSKIFRYSQKELKQISLEHVGISVYGQKPPLSQNLGMPEDVSYLRPYVALGEYCAGDVYLICSDGLTDMLGTDEIATYLNGSSLQEIGQVLLNKTLEKGGRDNVTFILIKVKKKKFKIFKKNK